MGTRELAHYINVNNILESSLHKDCLNSFKTKHPFFEVIVWSEKDINNLLLKEGFMLDFNRLTTFINKYNLVKYLILYKFGGWYIDSDIKWKKSIYNLISDRGIESFPQLFVPVRSFPNQNSINYRFNDDMLLYSDKGLFGELIKFCFSRKDIDETSPYEPFGPVSLSKWLHSNDYTREYLYEWEIQKDGIYCSHLGNNSWKYS